MKRTSKILKRTPMDKERLTVEQERKLEEFRRIFYNEFGLSLKFQVVSSEMGFYSFTENIEFYKALFLILNFTGWRYDEVLGISRKEHLLLARQIIYFVLYNNGMTINSISNFFEKDHATIINALRKFAVDIDYDLYSKQLLKEVVTNLREHYKDCKVKDKENMLNKLKIEL